MPVTDFFRNSKSWKQPDEKNILSSKSTMIGSEIITDRDVQTLEELEICLYNIRTKIMKKKDVESVYDNITLDNFMDRFTVMIDNIKKNRTIKDYVAHRPSPELEISTPVIYTD